MSRQLGSLIAVWLMLGAPVARAQGADAGAMLPAARPPDLAVRALPPDLAVRALPPPTSLAMRGPRVVAQAGSRPASAPAAQGARAELLPEPLARVRRQLRQQVSQLPGQLQTLAGMTVFRMSLGLGLAGGQPSREPRLSGGALTASDYQRLRMYYFGDAVLGSRDLIAPGLTTYLATRFRFDQDVPPVGVSSPVPSVYDPLDEDELRQRLLVRSAYGQTDGFFGIRRLAPLYVRLGRQYRYGPTVVHFDGITIGYAGRALAVDAFAGPGADPYGYVQSDPDTSRDVAGIQARLDLYQLRRLPLMLDVNALRAGAHSHAQLGAALRWSEDILLGGSLRWLDGNPARQRFDLHARISRVTTVVAAVDRRTEHDWMYDLFTYDPQRRANPERPRYLELHLPARRTHLDLRAGTVLLGNVDLLVRAAAAVSKDEPDSSSAYALEYAEGGGGFEVRLRRTWSVSASVLGRSYDREATEPMLEEACMGSPGTAGACPADLLPSLSVTGETSFIEGSITSHLTLGARSFSADIEVYGRDYDLVQVYRALGEERLDGLDRRGGLRVAAEGWPSSHLRLRAEYDVSFVLPTIPELRGIKSLRVMAEGQF